MYITSIHPHDILVPMLKPICQRIYAHQFSIWIMKIILQIYQSSNVALSDCITLIYER